MGLLLSSAVSCDNEIYPDLQYVYATTFLQGEATPFFFVSDDSTRIIPTNAQEIVAAPYKAVDGQRVIVYFTEEETPAPERSDKYIYANIQQIDDVLTKNMMVTSNLDTLQQDDVDLREVWISDNGMNATRFLNIQFKYTGSGTKAHWINLCYNPTIEWNDGYCILTFCHDAKGDFRTYEYNGMAAFIIPGDLAKDKGCKGFIVKYNSGGQTVEEKTATYK